jgi:hypothetical protein
VREQCSDSVMEQFEAAFWDALQQQIRDYESELASLESAVSSAELMP